MPDARLLYTFLVHWKTPCKKIGSKHSIGQTQRALLHPKDAVYMHKASIWELVF